MFTAESSGFDRPVECKVTGCGSGDLRLWGLGFRIHGEGFGFRVQGFRAEYVGFVV